MANIFTTIQRKINRDEFDFLPHCSKELDDEGFILSDAVKVIFKPSNYYEYDDDQSHIRYAFEGYTKEGRMLRVIVFLSQGRVKIKTGYEISS
jgi:uncharacterized DUF497 family protein